MKNNANFTESSTTQNTKINCDAVVGTCACDCGEYVSDAWKDIVARTGACLPNEWRCDGIVHCPTASDEANCAPDEVNSVPIEINLNPLKELYTNHTYSSHLAYPGHYENGKNRVETFVTINEMFFVLYFQKFQFEVNTIQGKCADSLKISYNATGHSLHTETLCGDMNNVVFSEEVDNLGNIILVPRRNFQHKMIIYASAVELEFNSDEYGHYEGTL